MRNGMRNDAGTFVIEGFFKGEFHFKRSMKELSSLASSNFFFFLERRGSWHRSLGEDLEAFQCLEDLARCRIMKNEEYGYIYLTT